MLFDLHSLYYSMELSINLMTGLLTIWQALGYVHGAEIIHAPEPVHGRLRYGEI